MVELNHELRIFSASMSELTFGQVRNLANFKDEDCIDGIVVFYDKDNDNFIINARHSEELYVFCEAGLKNPSEVLKKKIPRLCCRQEIARVILLARLTREAKEHEQKVEANPNARFVSVGDDIFQISKIVSIKKRDEGNESFIEIFITNKRASVRKKFATREMRDFEFRKIRKILELAG